MRSPESAKGSPTDAAHGVYGDYDYQSYLAPLKNVYYFRLLKQHRLLLQLL